MGGYGGRVTTKKEGIRMSVMTRRLVGGIALLGVLVFGSAGTALADEAQPDADRSDDATTAVVESEVTAEEIAEAVDVAATAPAQDVADEATELTGMLGGGLIDLLCGLIRGLPILGDLLVPLLGCPEPAAGSGGGLLPDLGGLLPDVGGLVPDVGGLVPDVGGLVPDVGGVVPEAPAVPAAQ